MRLRPRTLRGRLTLLFAVVTLALSLLVGLLVDVQYRSALTSAVDQGLETRLVAAVQQVEHASSTSTLKPAIPDAEAFAQVLDADGDIVAGAPRKLRRQTVLTESQFREARRHRIHVTAETGPRGEHVRLLAGPSKSGGVVVVGTALEEVASAQHRLELALGLGLPLLAALVTLVGWFVAGAVLRPVQEMIEDADVISARSARQLQRRLTVPDGAGEELIELATTLNHMLERIENAFEHEREFLDDASHELRTPIAIARGELELARMQVADASDTAVSLDSALEEVDRLDHLASSLLILARTRAAGPAPDRAFDLRESVDRAVQDALAVRRSAAPPGGGASPRVRVEGHATARGDGQAVERAVRNLVENALRHTRTDVVVTITGADDEAVVAVADDGPGFPADLLTRGVDRFTPGDSPETHGGAGLGLAIVDAIVRAHDGTVVLRNAADASGTSGAVVEVRLPAPSGANV
jgi:two-component system, OmpR family, sensor kinase